MSGLLDDAAHQYALADARLSAGVSEGLLRRAHNWLFRLHRYEQFWNERGRTPRERTRDITTLPDEERRLGEWAARQRRFEHGLTTYQRARLDVSPAFEWDPWDAQWHRNLTACGDLLSRSGRLPALSAEGSSEHALARWLGRQLRANQSRRLAPSRQKALAELLATSRSGIAARGGRWLPHRESTESST